MACADPKTKRALDRIRISNPKVMEALKRTFEEYRPLEEVTPDRLATLLTAAAASVRLSPDLFLWVTVGLGASLLPDVLSSLRGNEVTGSSVQINIAANIGAGKSTSSNMVKHEFLDANTMLGMAGDIIVHARGSIQGIAIALVAACKANGRAAVV